MPRPFSGIPLLFIVVVLVGGSAVQAGCTRSPRPIASPAAADAAPAPTGSDGLALVDEPPGTIACHQLRAAVTDATLMEPGVVTAIVAASGTADAPVADAAQELATAYTSAVAAKGTESEPAAIAAVSAVGATMAGVCDDSGLDTVG